MEVQALSRFRSSGSCQECGKSWSLNHCIEGKVLRKSREGRRGFVEYFLWFTKPPEFSSKTFLNVFITRESPRSSVIVHVLATSHLISDRDLGIHQHPSRSWVPCWHARQGEKQFLPGRPRREGIQGRLRAARLSSELFARSPMKTEKEYFLSDLWVWV